MDRRHNAYDTPRIPPNPAWERHESELAAFPPVILDAESRAIVEATIRDLCAHKVWATRRLVEAGLHERGRPGWARHGSTRYLWTPRAVERACQYTLCEQGDREPPEFDDKETARGMD